VQTFKNHIKKLYGEFRVELNYICTYMYVHYFYGIGEIDDPVNATGGQCKNNDVICVASYLPGSIVACEEISGLYTTPASVTKGQPSLLFNSWARIGA
jgi:hypothetical protein